MCLNCAFRIEGQESLECEICIRNPQNISKKFSPVKYLNTLIERPIDMYISKELLKILNNEKVKAYQEGYLRGNTATTSSVTLDWHTQHLTSTSSNQSSILKHPWIVTSIDVGEQTLLTQDEERKTSKESSIKEKNVRRKKCY